MKNTLSKGKSNSSHKFRLLASILVFVLLFTLFEPLAVSATTTGTKISNGIDYSGKGTVIDGDIRDGVATINGKYVNVPIYTYGAYTYNTWDEFWATWSSWSTSNSKYSGYKGYRYAPENKHIVDFESKTEYQYRRWNDKLNPVYKTKYITKYQKCTKVLFVNVYTYHTEYSYSGYPGAKSGYTIYSRRTERVLDYYRGGYEYYGAWSDSKPFTMPWETSWSSYKSRKTYRVKKIDCTWDPDWKNESTELVPLNYSIYKSDGSPMYYGAKWTYSKYLSNEKNIPGQIIVVDRYMLNSAGIAQLLNGKEDALDRLIANNGTSWWELAVGTGIGIATLQANPYVGAAVFVAETLYGLQGAVIDSNMQSKYDSIKEILVMAQDYDINIVFEYYQASTTNGGYSYYNMREFTTQRNYLSMKYQNNENPQYGYFTNDAFGLVSYIKDTKIVVDQIDLYVKLKSIPQFIY